MKSLICTAAVLASIGAAPVFAQPSSNVEPRGSLSGVGGASVSGPRADVFEAPVGNTPSPSSGAVGGDVSGSVITHPDTTSSGSTPSRSTSASGGASTSASGPVDSGMTQLRAPPSDYPPCRNRSQDRCRVSRR